MNTTPTFNIAATIGKEAKFRFELLAIDMGVSTTKFIKAMINHVLSNQERANHIIEQYECDTAYKQEAYAAKIVQLTERGTK